MSRGIKRFLAGTGVFCILLISGCGRSQEEKQLRLAGIEQLDQGNYEEAIASFEQALKAADGKVGNMELDILKYRGEAEYKSGDFLAAAHTYDVLIQVDGQLPEYLYGRSICYAGAGQLEEAGADYTQARNMDVQMDREVSWNMEALLALGKGYQAAGENQKAADLYDSAIAGGAIASAEMYNVLGAAQIEAGMYDKALQLLDQGIALGDQEAMGDLMYNKAVALEYSGEFSRALDLFLQYKASYGSDEKLEKEIAFLSTR